MLPQYTPVSRKPVINAECVRSVLADLLDGYLRLDATGGAPAALEADVVRRRVLQLQLAEAALRYGAGRPSSAARTGKSEARPPQVAVIGPTQVGKSTLVNLLIGQQVAGVSPLAGYTVHAHGFWIGPEARDGGAPPDEPWVRALFPGWRLASGDPPREVSEAFALGVVQGAARVPPCVVWDTPDFDSLASQAYRRAVTEVIGLADVVLLAVSKEKYADLSVWNMLKLIAPLRRPLVVCVNKVNAETREVVPAALRSRLLELGERGGAAGACLKNARVFAVDHRPGVSVTKESAAEQVTALRDHLVRELERAARADTAPGVGALLRAHWADWTAPIAAEESARRQWRELVDAELESLRTAYRRDFLDHPHRYDSFRRVTLELLRLLELPGIAATVHRVREVITWPARKLFALGQSWLQQRRAGPEGRAGSEERVLLGMVDNVLLRLERAAAAKAETATAGRQVWRAIAERLRERGADLRAHLATETHAHCDRVTAEIHAAADRLYQMLEKSPALLNSLRAVRATADGVAIAVAIKTGGVATHDLVLAPAMLAVSSMLAQGALGGYMQHAAEDLKREQMRKVSELLFDAVFARALHAVDEAGAAAAFKIDGQRLEAASAALRSWEPDS